ncbi:MAG: ParB/RepB/Spo0J family partition protein [Myxococcales bacterium]|nr:ParB/RepB/Spo0J family partition protein [Myxococcales bacterium]
MVPLDELRANPEQPREVFSSEELEELAESIRIHGVISPLIVRRQDGRYILIAGERRMRAAALAGLTEVPVVVRDADDSKTQLELALVENLQRSDLDPIESARGFQRLVSEHGYTQDEVAKAVGKNRATIANAIRLLNLPDFVLTAIREGGISAGHARALLPIAEEEDDLRNLLAKVMSQNLNVRQVERIVGDQVRTPPVISTERRRKEHAMEYAEKLLREALHTSVLITPTKKGGGRIQIDYSDAEDLERLIGRLRGEAA